MDEKRRILIIDDDPEVVWGIGRYLARSGFSVTTCGDGTEAIELLEQEPFDVLVTDIQMPGLNGLAVLDWAREHRPRLRKMVMTAYGTPTIKQVSMRKGASVYLEKPVDPKLLVDVLSRPPKRDTFSGVVDSIDLFDYVQLMLVAKHSVVLEVFGGEGDEGQIYIERGQVKHAECGKLHGEEAFYHCLSFAGGSFATLPWRAPEKETIQAPGDFLLMEAARMKDETLEQAANEDLAKQPADDHMVEIEL
jgi:CheY-like chemotaxis protein